MWTSFYKFHFSGGTFSNFHGSFHGTAYPSYDTISTSSVAPLTITTDLEQDHSGSALKNSPIEGSDRSESSFSSKVDICSKTEDDLAEISGNPIETTYPNCGEENVSSK